MTGFTEFIPINLKAIFTNVNLLEQKITVDVTYKGGAIVALKFDLLEGNYNQEGSFDEIKHLEEFGIDKEYIINRIKQYLDFIVKNNISDPDVLNI